MPRKKKVEVTEEVIEETPQPKKAAKVAKDFISGTGRRKTAVARVFIWDEKGEFTINDTPISDYFKTDLEENTWIRPFHLIGVSHPKAKFTASVKVRGSGTNSQLGAIVHAFSRALAKMSDENRSILAKAGLLTRDSRMVERKKPFLHKARKRPQYSKR